MLLSVLECSQLLDRYASSHIRFHSEFGRTCTSSYCQPQKFGMFFVSVFCLCLLSLLVEWRPAGPQAQVANIWWHCLNSLHCLKYALWKPEQEKAVRKTKLMGDLAVGWLQGSSTVLKMAAVKRCDSKREQGRSNPPPPTYGWVCLNTLSHALDSPGHQIKCRQASMSSWVRRCVCAWTQVWTLR